MSLSILDRLKGGADGKYVVITGVTPTPLGKVHLQSVCTDVRTVRDTDNLHFSADAPRWVSADRRAAMCGYPRGNARIVRAGMRGSSVRIYNAKISAYERKRRLVKQYLRSHVVGERALAIFNLSVALKHPH